jgi:hypothetical protein
MLTEPTIRRQRTTLEADARSAAAGGDFETWLRAIGGIVALDLVINDRLAHPAERYPFSAMPVRRSL